MKLKDIKIDLNLEIPDIPGMYEMSEEEYKKYITSEGIFFFDHHDILRDSITGRPLATTLEQLDVLLDELKKYRAKMQPKETR
jgi:hypothetical protein